MNEMGAHRYTVRIRFAFVVYIGLLIAISIFPLSFKLRLHTHGPFHNFAHYVAFLLTAVFLWFITERVWGRLLGLCGGVVFAYSQEWAENKLYHAGFEWKDVSTDIAGLISGFALMTLIRVLLSDNSR